MNCFISRDEFSGKIKTWLLICKLESYLSKIVSLINFNDLHILFPKWDNFGEKIL